ncbi:hypothetical protein DWV16_01580 [Anaerotruncus sp. AF02-27]|uniref:hypothetical protein n=1 Tax=Anaerotruncus sp. AF02-27 TaxID=2292191 RepID=UPI000E4B604F|nr:hypothetical protein [Anaerotruncus sp. AF02-27]RGX57034.1 hypothetical protein DWV16_01580 [Anaerotruncus sp. AF02-27]
MTKTKKAPQAVAAAQSATHKDQLHNTASREGMQDQYADEMLNHFRDAKETGRNGETLIAFKSLTAESTLEEIKACVEIALALSPEAEPMKKDNPELFKLALELGEVMARSYVQGMREAREAEL